MMVMVVNASLQSRLLKKSHMDSGRVRSLVPCLGVGVGSTDSREIPRHFSARNRRCGVPFKPAIQAPEI